MIAVALRRALLVGTLVVLAAILELTVLAPLGLPGATPSLVVVVVAGIAFTFGPLTGASAGFAAGLLLDLAPPAAGTVGISALVLTVIGYALGRVFEADERPLLLTTGLTAAAAGVAVLAGALLGGLLGNPRVLWDEVPSMTVAAALYSGILAVPVVPLIRAAARRVVPEAFPR